MLIPIIIVSLFALFGCSGKSASNPEPAFTYHQAVKVEKGFYRNISGQVFITDYNYCRDNNDKLTICYSLAIYSLFGISKLDKTVFEADLTPVYEETE